MYLLTQEQEEWVITQRYLWVARPVRHFVPPKKTWRRLIFDVVSSTGFELTIMAVIFVNVIVMSCTYHGMSDQTRHIIDVINFTCTLFFAAEVIVKLIAFGHRNYFRVRREALQVMAGVKGKWCLGSMECV